MKNYHQHIISAAQTISDALRSLNNISIDSQKKETAAMNLFIVDGDGRMQGTISDGDIRRGLLDGKVLSDSVCKIMNTHFHFLEENKYDLGKINEFRQSDLDLIPILNQKNQIIDVFDLTKKKSLLPVDAVLMAGGEGKRLRPLTEDVPKPLLEVGDKPIIEHIIDRIDKYGIPNLLIAVNYLADQFIKHFDDCKQKWDLSIDFFREEKPLGTMGALSLMDDFKHDTILLSNADLLSTIDYEKFYQSFIESEADIAVASVPYNVKVPFGVFETNGTEILSIQEKPEYSYFSNAGIYLMKQSVLSHLPENEYVDITDFLKQRIENHSRVTYYPMLGYWQDIGRYEDFLKVQKDVNLIEI